ncbi:MAG: alcohol dehydrogenase catalytic domain-containing protein [Anaerolineae bacterium]
MNEQGWQLYRQGLNPLPAANLSWPFRGGGLENFGVSGQPITEPIPTCGPDQLLVRVDAVGLCPSDAKMVKLGNNYPLFFNRDFQRDPGRLGHEVSLTIIEVGEQWREHYTPGQRLGLQPNIYLHGQRVIFGVNLPGALTQYLTLGPEVLAADGGSHVFPVPAAELSYVEIALLEPWSCVEVAYSQYRRLEPRPGGVMWLKGRPGDEQNYTMSRPLDSARVILTDVPEALAQWVQTQPVEVVVADGCAGETLRAELTGGTGFDDIILLDPRQADIIAASANCLATRGVLNLVSPVPLDRPVSIDVARLHYESISYLGCPGPDLAAAYGPAKNRSELRPGGITWIVGAGGPLGRMHLQRALEMPDGPRVVIATNRREARLASLAQTFGSLAKASGRELVLVSPTAEPGRLEREIARLTGGRGCDDIVAVAPTLAAIEQAVPFLAADGMLILFAGFPAGSRADLPLDRVALSGAQITGTSGSTVTDEVGTMAKVVSGQLSPARSLVAIGGLRAARAGLQAVMEQTYPGKIVIFPQLLDLPLLGLPELHMTLPAVAAQLGPNQTWAPAAERVLFDHFL